MFTQGDWTGGEAMAQAVLPGAERNGNAELNATLVLGMGRARRGDPQARPTLERSLELALTKIVSRISKVNALVRLAEMYWLLDDGAKALEYARRAFEESSYMQAHPWIRGQAAFWLWRVSEEHNGDAHNGDARDTPYALQLAGDWNAAAAAWERMGCPYERAMALVDGGPAEQREAFAIFDRLGASATIRRCREMLAARGVTHIPRGPRPTTRANPMGLTDRESEVLVLMAEGLHNAEIGARLHRSEKTVAHHVSSIIGKLGATTRQQAVRAARTKGLLDPDS